MVLNIEKVELIMAKQKLSQRDMADYLGVGTSTVSGYFKNPDRVRAKTIGRLSDALQVEIEAIID